MSELTEKIAATYRRIRERGDDGVWVSLVPEEESLNRAGAIEASDLPLKGQLFAIKDNIDLAGLPTTAGCPEFAYTSEKNAHVVQRLIDAGAIPIGKTNLDQFATGLNGTRTPYPIPGNSIDAHYIPGGSSSGSAVAVGLGEVDFALGTDTAGSGRVPAAFNNLIGFKPSKGRWSNSGLVPACRSLDCITVFTRTLKEALLVDRIAKGFDEKDPYSRRERAGGRIAANRVAVLREEDREFFGDVEYARLYQEAVERAAILGWEVSEFHYPDFLDAAALLYSGPWVGERHAALRDFLATHADAVNPVVRSIVESAVEFSATDAFLGQYKLAELARRVEPTWEEFDALLLPTAGTIYTIAEMVADPIRLNSNLGRYTNFVNLLDLCAIAVPAGFRGDGMPFGVTFIGPAWSEATLANLAGKFIDEPISLPETGVKLAVVGAHLRGQPLNSQLINLGAQFVKACRTSADYRLHALPNTTPAKPGMTRRKGGGAIEIEVWNLSHESFGKFVAAIPPPLGIGTITLESGELVKGFLCEEAALEGAEEITHFGGWRAYLGSLAS